MNLGSVAARHPVVGGTHESPKIAGYEPNTGDIGNLGNNPNLAFRLAVVAFTRRGDDDSASGELCLLPQKKHAATHQRDNVIDFIVTKRKCKAKRATKAANGNF